LRDGNGHHHQNEHPVNRRTIAGNATVRSRRAWEGFAGFAGIPGLVGSPPVDGHNTDSRAPAETSARTRNLRPTTLDGRTFIGPWQREPDDLRTSYSRTTYSSVWPVTLTDYRVAWVLSRANAH
jgi:hypothetical protein